LFDRIWTQPYTFSEMFGLKDLILLITIFGSLGLGLYWPALGEPLTPGLTYFLIFLLFLSFLQLKMDEVWTSWKKHRFHLITLGIIKLLALPLSLFFLFHWLWPEYALPVLLLSGVSTGVTAPFISGLVGAQTTLVLGMVVLTSLFLPFSLPILVRSLSGAELQISFGDMFRVLALVIFFPALLVAVLRRICPRILETLSGVRYPLSLLCFALINLAVFSRYQGFFWKRPLEILKTTLVAYLLSLIFHGVGWVIFKGQQVEVRLAQTVSLAYVNNILVVVFAAHFFGPLATTLSVMYLLPFFTFIVPLRLLGGSTRT
jgi:bile acid:Na+ symporter, BASS family